MLLCSRVGNQGRTAGALDRGITDQEEEQSKDTHTDAQQREDTPLVEYSSENENLHPKQRNPGVESGGCPILFFFVIVKR